MPHHSLATANVDVVAAVAASVVAAAAVDADVALGPVANRAAFCLLAVAAADVAQPHTQN